MWLASPFAEFSMNLKSETDLDSEDCIASDALFFLLTWRSRLNARHRLLESATFATSLKMYVACSS